MFENNRALAVDNLKTYATELKLDTAKFNTCLDTDKYKKSVDQDMSEGQAIGVTGTPAFFVNGRFLSGALPYEKFVAIIDEELDLKGL